MVDRTTRRIAVVWDDGRPEGKIEVRTGDVRDLTIAYGQGTASGDRFAITSEGPAESSSPSPTRRYLRERIRR